MLWVRMSGANQRKSYEYWRQVIDRRTSPPIRLASRQPNFSKFKKVVKYVDSGGHELKNRKRKAITNIEQLTKTITNKLVLVLVLAQRDLNHSPTQSFTLQ